MSDTRQSKSKSAVADYPSEFDAMGHPVPSARAVIGPTNGCAVLGWSAQPRGLPSKTWRGIWSVITRTKRWGGPAKRLITLAPTCSCRSCSQGPRRERLIHRTRKQNIN